LDHLNRLVQIVSSHAQKHRVWNSLRRRRSPSRSLLGLADDSNRFIALLLSPELLHRVGLELVAGHHLVGSDQA
jgi:hypothetical protein